MLEERLRSEAPGIELRVRPKLNPAIVLQLDAGEIDFAIGVMDEPPARIRHITLFHETYVCIMRRSHPLAAAALGYEDFIAADHLAITHEGEATQVLDRLLEKRNVSRRIALTINQSLLAPDILRRSDLILTTFVHTARCLPAFADLHVTGVPMETDSMPVRLLWHDGLVKHPAHEWLRNIVMDICARIEKAE
jgi:DNA-binding transcriptional LysR family regulator